MGENWMFSAGFDKKVIITETVNGRALGSLPDFRGRCNCDSYSSKCKIFCIGLSTGKVQVYAVAKLELQKTYIDSKDKISTICYSD